VDPTLLQDYSALADPRFKGRVCVRSSENVYNLSFMAALIEHSGRAAALKWARGVVANMARPPQGGDLDQIKAVAAGVCDLAFTNTYYWLRLQASDDASERRAGQETAVAFPSLAGAGTHVNISGGGVAANAPNRDAAVKFLEFLASDEAQAVFAGANHEFPGANGVSPPTNVAALGAFAVDPLPVVVYGRRQAEAQSVFDEAGWR
jgi:iron(III) transport system substrate-binding protein